MTHLRVLPLTVFSQICLLYSGVYTEFKTENCPQSVPTIDIVDACPKDITEYIKAKERKQCYLISQNCTSADKFEYHCLPNSLINMFVEVCAPTKVIVGQHCACYDMEHYFVAPNFNQPCKEHIKPCPAVYTSSSVYKYQECYHDKKKKTTNDNNMSPIQIFKWSEEDDRIINKQNMLVCVLLIVMIQLLLIHMCCTYGLPCTLKKNSRNTCTVKNRCADDSIKKDALIQKEDRL